MTHQLWDLRGKTEGVGQPQHGCFDIAECLAKIAATEGQLPNECLGAGDVQVRLDPHAAHDLPSTLGHSGSDLLKNGGVVSLHHRIKLGL